MVSDLYRAAIESLVVVVIFIVAVVVIVGVVLVVGIVVIEVVSSSHHLRGRTTALQRSPWQMQCVIFLPSSMVVVQPGVVWLVAVRVAHVRLIVESTYWLAETG